MGADIPGGSIRFKNGAMVFPDEAWNDGGPLFVSPVLQEILRDWDPEELFDLARMVQKKEKVPLRLAFDYLFADLQEVLAEEYDSPPTSRR